MKKVFLFIFLLYSINLFAERYIVEFSGKLPDRKADGFVKSNAKYNFIVIDSDFDRIKSTYPDASKIYREPKVRAFYTPNDTYFSYQWSLSPVHYNLSHILDRGILGSRSVVIGVLDTGVSFEDYPIPSNEQGLVVSATNEYEMYSDFESVNFVQGYDFVSDDSHPNDMNGHGTAVTSVIASSINNALATSGIIMEASIMPLRVLDETGAGNLTDILDAIEYGVSNGCDVLNLSLGGEPGDSNGWDILHSAIIDARNSDVMVLAASGNDNVNMLSYPAGFEETVSVGAVDYYFERAPYSQYGTNLDFVAPGGYVYQDINGDGENEGGILCPMPEQTESGANVNDFYLYFVEGTSFSTPHLSALAALMYSMGYSTVDEITSLMIDASLDLGGTGYDLVYGWGYPKPESLFSQPVAIKTVDFDIASNILFFSMIILNDSFSLDSITISSLLVNEKLNYESYGKIIMTEFSASKSGVYTITVFGKKNAEGYQFKREIALKSMSDPSNFVYHGNIQMLSDSPFALFFDKENVISPLKQSVKVVIPSKNSSRSEVFCGDIKIKASRFSDRIEFIADRKGTYRVLESSSSAYPAEDIFSRKSILLSNTTLDLEGREGNLYDKSGRLLANSRNFTISFEKLPAGIYFVTSKNMLWKITKLF
ncbi:MAG: S8 family serine peptidase [bacterium]|nr:S8 family serine peptidase [bacterium]